MTAPMWLVRFHDKTYRPWMTHALNVLQVATWFALAGVVLWACI